jgi:hypothetical protein
MVALSIGAIFIWSASMYFVLSHEKALAAQRLQQKIWRGY